MMKHISIPIIYAVVVLTTSVSAFVSPSSVTKRSVLPSNGVSSVAAGNQRCRSPSFSLFAKEDTIGEIIHDMLDASKFVYGFANLRRIVKANEGKIRKKKTSAFKTSEQYTVAFDTPALILTQDGAQEESKDKFFKYVVTPDAVLSFIQKNRKWFKEPDGGGDWAFDESVTEKSEPFIMEEKVKEATKDNLKIVDYDDEFSTKDGGLVYGVVINLTKKWVAVTFRGTIGKTDFRTDADFRLDHDSFFSSEGDIFVSGGKPGTHKGFTRYLVDEKMGDQDGRKVIDRILSCVNGEFENNPDVAGKDFNLYVTGHSLGGGLANLFAFRAAHLKAKDDESVKFLPGKITALTFAAPVVGNHDYNKEFQYLEKKGILRHIRVANKGDAVPTNNVIKPFSFFLKGNTKKYTQNGVNLFLHADKELEVGYRATKSCRSQLNTKIISNHLVTEYTNRVKLDVNSRKYQQTVEEVYEVAGDFTN